MYLSTIVTVPNKKPTSFAIRELGTNLNISYWTRDQIVAIKRERRKRRKKEEEERTTL